MTGVSVTFVHSFHPIRCDFVAVVLRKNGSSRRGALGDVPTDRRSRRLFSLLPPYRSKLGNRSVVMPPTTDSPSLKENFRQNTGSRRKKLYGNLIRLNLDQRVCDGGSEPDAPLTIGPASPSLEWPLPVTGSVVLSPNLTQATNATFCQRRSQPH
jgi:hypothetical protein